MNRTLKFHGIGFGSSPVTINVVANGNVVYNGTVTTIDQPFTSDWFAPDQYVELFSTEIPVSFAGAVPMSVTVNSGTALKLAHITANYVLVPNPVFTAEQLETVTQHPRGTQPSRLIYESLANPPLTPQEVDVIKNPSTTQQDFEALLAAHNISPLIPGGDSKFRTNFTQFDARTNIALDGIPVAAPDPRPPGAIGHWTWDILSGSTLSFDLMVDAAAQ